MFCLEITIPIASTWPSRDELAARNTVEHALKSASIGKCTGAGGGMGQMHLTYRVTDESAARAAIAEAMKAHMPSFQYSLKGFEQDQT
jgi:hypothetical protein